MPAPKGNKYALGNKGGRPRKYTPERVEEIKQLLAAYIDSNEMPILAEFGYLNNVDSRHLYDYQEFSELIREAIQKKESYLEKNMLTNKINVTGAIFSLKQLGWSDKKLLEGDFNFKTDLSKLSTNKLKKIEAIMDEEE